MVKASRRLLLLGAAAAALGGFGCPGPPKKDAEGTGKPAETGAQQSAGTGFRAALVFDTGGKDDKSFNASANAGLERAQKELNLGENGIKTVESHASADYKTNLTNFASQKYDVVIAVGFNMADAVKEVSAQFPNTRFAIVDSDAPEGSKNVAGLRFQEEQGCFLAGFLAASVSKTHKIGFVGGMKIPLIEKFEAGYKAGALTAGFDPSKQVTVTYVGDWDDLSKGKSQAKQQFDLGADIVFQAAGKAGLAVITEAKERGKGFYAIGVDQDQDYIAEGSVLTSMVKHVDTSVFDTIKDAKEGKFSPGNHVFGMKDGGVSLSEMKYTKQVVPADVLSKLDKLSKMITDGTVKPPATLAELASFKAPKL
jgi:basic membrane protein A and related proteins